MRKLYGVLAVLVAAVLVIGSGATPQSASAPEEEAAAADEGGVVPQEEGRAGAGRGEYASEVLSTDYEGALPPGTQLALGSLLLADADQAITPDQAGSLLPLWQALQGGVTAAAEVSAVLKQIEGTMTADQLSEIASMELTQEGMTAWMREQGVGLAAGRGAGGQGGQLSEDELATRQAERASGEGGGGFGAGGGEVPPEMATRRAEMQNMTEEERQEAIATMRAEGAGGGRLGGAGGPAAGGGGAVPMMALLQPLIEMLQGLADGQ